MQVPRSIYPMNISLPVADSLKVHSRFTPVREIRISLQCPIPCETLLRNQFTIHLHLFLGGETFVRVYANLYGIVIQSNESLGFQ
jgi:hypothetical protein